MASFFDSELSKSLLVLAMASALAACGGESGGSDDDSDTAEEEHDHEGGRLLYSVDNASGISLYDQTNEEAPFTETAITTSEVGVDIVLASSGLTAAMVDNDKLYLIDSGLEDHDDEEGDDYGEEDHNEAPSSALVELSGNVSSVLATREYFSVLNGSNSTVIDAEDGDVIASFSAGYYPALALTGDHYLIFESSDGAVNITVVESDQSPLTPSVTASCTGNIKDTAQTEHLTQVLCGNGTLLSFVAEEGETDTSFTLSQTENSGLENLVATASEYDVIAGWAADAPKLTLFKISEASVVSADVTSEVSSPAILDVAALTSDENDVLGVLGSDGRFFALTFHAEGTELEIDDNDKFQLESGQTWSSSNRVLADSEAFIAINTENQTLYFIDGHDEEDYHLHSSASGDENLAELTSAVLAHVQEKHGEEGHDEEGHDHD